VLHRSDLQYKSDDRSPPCRAVRPRWARTSLSP
jgi:hypothetical protein